MRLKRLVPPILLILGFTALLFLIKYRDLVKELSTLNMEKIEAYISGAFSEASATPKRRRPLSLVQKETELKLYIGEPFKSFTFKDWNEFWNIIYGVFPKEPPKIKGLPEGMRQLTADEIAFELMKRYPQPFVFFKEEHWKLFFEIALKK